MKVGEFDIPSIFSQVFGFIPVHFDVKDLPIQQQSGKIGGTPFHKRDALGRNYFLPVQLGTLDLSLPVIRINGKKNIVETTLVNRQGTVKELISIDEYKISVRGLMVGDGRNWPEDDVAKLQEIYQQNKALSLKCAVTDIFLIGKGSDKVVVTNLDIMETKSFKSVVPYQIDMITDSEFELIIK